MEDFRMRFRALASVASSLILALSACKDSAPVPTGPTPPKIAAAQLAAGTQSSDKLASRLSSAPGSCLVGVRSADGHYQTRPVTVPLPKKVSASSTSLARFAYRGWTQGIQEPTILAVCTIPDAASALSYFENLFGAKAMNATELVSFAQSAGVAGAEDWLAAPPHVMRGAAPAYMTDGLASEANLNKTMRADGGAVAMLVPVCDPNAPDPNCTTAGEMPPDPNTPPDPSGLTISPTLDVSSSGFPINRLPTGWPRCRAGTDNPHGSTTPGSIGRLSVHAHQDCVAPFPQYVSVTLKREKCLWYFICSWLSIAANAYSNPSAMHAETEANATCSWNAWYRGVGVHQTVFPEGVGGITSSSYDVFIYCS